MTFSKLFLNAFAKRICKVSCMDVIHTIENSTINYQCLKDEFQSIEL
jgi:hypothetical protein